MRVAIVGAGFTGLSAAYKLTQRGYQVSVFEQNTGLGGLAAGIKTYYPEESHAWDWDLEQYYHHWFTNDQAVFNLAKEINTRNKIIIKNPRSDVLFKDQTYPLDSALNLLKFPHIPLIERIKTGTMITKLKYLFNERNSQVFESVSAHDYLLHHSGEKAYHILWEPLLIGKFGIRYKEINMRWFWARIHKRTHNLAYYEGGFSQFLRDLTIQIEKQRGKISTSTPVTKIVQLPNSDQFELHYLQNQTEVYERFDSVIVTTPPYTLGKLVSDLPEDYLNEINQQEGIGALVLTLCLHHPLMNRTYWLNINDPSWPFLALVEHTNFIPKEKYNGENIVYVGTYCDKSDARMQLTKEELVEKFTPYLKRICPLFSHESIVRSFLFQSNYAQPLFKLNQEEKILPLVTPIKNLYLASMAQVYPWDRGTNYAIELGLKVSEIISGK